MSRFLDHYLKPFQRHLDRPEVTDVIVNRPGEIGVAAGGVWEWYDEPILTFNVLLSIAYCAAFESGQDTSASQPLCATALPGGERVQICIPPVTAPGIVSLSIRRPAAVRRRLDALRVSSEAAEVEESGNGVVVSDRLQAAVIDHLNIVICGERGSGKTTLGGALIEDIPRDERLITIEDTYEWKVPHRNWIALKYSKGDQSVAKGVGAETLIEASLRMWSDRVLMQELRDGAAFAYLRSMVAGQTGCITTLHAGSAMGAFDALGLMVRQHPAAASMSKEDVRDLLKQHIHVVVHCERLRNKQYRFTETYL